ncbi:protein CNGC15c isoform X1 [Daucus carota subsp. sativus]|uniref:protein CNGC15c isoform X1 n=1 Tax=Daucus carota subsp. sativus TaxID=79200 RepID=UPI0007EF1C1E|nr:PREDICTED: putative cyclic nucleotide-gated ion channel 15 [Daucus carota subsp. sativus]
MRSSKAKALLSAIREDYERAKKKKMDPQGPISRRWNNIFLVACLISLFADPMFFYLPVVKENLCIDTGTTLEVILTIVRSLNDAFYMIQIYVRFRTAYEAPSSRVFWRGELVTDYWLIAKKYLFKDFWIDLIASLPLPQVLIWIVIPSLSGSTMANTRDVLKFIIIFQYLPRLFLILFPLSAKIAEVTGSVTETAWAGAAYNLLLYMLASHFVGACWYLLSIDRQEACWRSVCNLSELCKNDYFDCHKANDAVRSNWFKSSKIKSICNPRASSYPFGIYGDAVTKYVTTSRFCNKYFYCLWWGLRNLSSLGQGLGTTTYAGEICFAVIIAVLGLLLFALLIGNMQTYLQSTTVRLEEWRMKKTDTEQWMRRRQLPEDLRQRVRKYNQYKWVALRGVDEEALLKDLPPDLRRDIKRHFCYDLVRRVPLFDQMDELMLEAICLRLKPVLFTKHTFLVYEGGLVDEMLFIIRGKLLSCTTNGGQSGFFHSFGIGPGDLCGEELLTWAFDPRPSVIRPSATHSVQATSEVEAFALIAEDLKVVASRFGRLHSKQLRPKLRHSHQWRTWAACIVQAAWRSYRIQKITAELKAKESLRTVAALTEDMKVHSDKNVPSPSSGFSICVQQG